jgi:outer membrane protein
MKIFLLVLIFTSAVLPQQLLTPEDAVKTALDKNFSIRIARNNLEIAENNYSPGAAGFYPDITADGSYTRSNSSARLEFLTGGTVDRNDAFSENLNAAVNLNWTIFDGLRMFASLHRLKELRRSGELDLKDEIENNIADIYSAYYSIVRQQRLLKLIEYNISLSEERLRIEKDKKEVGSSSGFDVRRAEVDLNEDRASYLREELRLVQSKLLLKNLMGLDSGTEFIVTDTIPIRDKFEIDELISLTGKNNSSIRLAEVRRNISELETDVARSDLFPRLSLFTGYNFLKSESEAGQVTSNRTHGYSYGVRASWNLFNGLNTRRNIENAIISSENSRISYDQTYSFIISELMNVFKIFENGVEQINLEMRNMQSAEENVDIALERLKLGNISPLEFREAQIDLLNAQNRLISAQVDTKIAETDLLRLSGLLVRD